MGRLRDGFMPRPPMLGLVTAVGEIVGGGRSGVYEPGNWDMEGVWGCRSTPVIGLAEPTSEAHMTKLFWPEGGRNIGASQLQHADTVQQTACGRPYVQTTNHLLVCMGKRGRGFVGMGDCRNELESRPVGGPPNRRAGMTSEPVPPPTPYPMYSIQPTSEISSTSQGLLQC